MRDCEGEQLRIAIKNRVRGFKMSEYKMIVLDLDGTLTNRNKEITPKTKETLMKAQEQGKIVVLASGRPTYGVMPLAEELHLEDYGGYILSFNGGIIMNCKTKEVVFSRQIPAESNGKIIDLAQEHNVSILTYENRTLLTNRPEDQYVQLESRINTLKIIPMTIEELKAHVTFSVPKFLMTDDGDYLAMVEPKVKAALGKILVSTALTRFSWRFCQRGSIRPSL